MVFVMCGLDVSIFNTETYFTPPPWKLCHRAMLLALPQGLLPDSASVLLVLPSYISALADSEFTMCHMRHYSIGCPGQHGRFTGRSWDAAA